MPDELAETIYEGPRVQFSYEQGRADERAECAAEIAALREALEPFACEMEE